MIGVKEVLEEVGLSENESEVYLALLRLGEQTASRVSEIAELNRVTTYMLLKALCEKGFCSVFDKNNVQYFRPVRPEQILSLLEEKKNKVKMIIPILKERENTIEEKPEIDLFEGKKGITAMFDLLLKDAERKKEVLTYGNFSIAEKLIEYQSLHWRKTRLEKKIKVKAIADVSPPDYVETGKKWRALSETKVDKRLAKLSSYILVTENYAGYLTLKGELTGVLIKSKEIADMERFNFERLWK